jgi:hypothetical protein
MRENPKIRTWRISMLSALLIGVPQSCIATSGLRREIRRSLLICNISNMLDQPCVLACKACNKLKRELKQNISCTV